MSDNYLIHGANALKDALKYTVGDDFKYDKNSVELFVSIACTTLTMLLEDGKVLEQIATGTSLPHENKFFYFRNFVEEFIKPDKALMIAAGMDESLANYLFSDLDNVKKVLMQMEKNARNDNVGGVSWFRGRIQELQDSVCHKEVFRNKGFRGVPASLRRVINITGGAAIVTTNVSADLVIGGVASAFSQGYGGHLVIKGIEGG